MIRRHELLNKMREGGHLTPEEFQALKKPLPFPLERQSRGNYTYRDFRIWRVSAGVWAFEGTAEEYETGEGVTLTDAIDEIEATYAELEE